MNLHESITSTSLGGYGWALALLLLNSLFTAGCTTPPASQSQRALVVVAKDEIMPSTQAKQPAAPLGDVPIAQLKSSGNDRPPTLDFRAQPAGNRGVVDRNLKWSVFEQAGLPSVPGTTSEQYFALIRNFRRRSWLLLYLFGASPAVCSSFVAGRQHELKELVPGTMYAPHGTSLRMGRLGYQSEAQA